MRAILLSLAMSAALACSCAIAGDQAPNERIQTDKSFRSTLTYVFAYRLYWMPFLIAKPAFGEWSGAEDGSLAPLLGTKIHGKLLKGGDVYWVEFKDLSHSKLRYIGLKKAEDGKWESGMFERKEPLETIDEDYEFEIPLSFPHIASKFSDNAEPIIERLRTELENAVAEMPDASAGENHFFIGPFAKCVFNERVYIYWVEKKEILRVKPFAHGNDIATWRRLDFDRETLTYADTGMFIPDDKLKDDNDTQFGKSEITHRLSWSNVIVANCVRDGRLITVIKKTPPAPGSKP